jgi:FixJ family two-component response regulator
MYDNSKITVYLIDDDDSIRNAIEMLLQSANMNVETFISGEKFLQFNPQNNRSCIISDLKMKGLDGFSLCEKLKKKGVNIPIIFLTAFDSQEYRKRAREIGASGYMSKPVDDQALIDSINWAMSKK